MTLCALTMGGAEHLQNLLRQDGRSFRAGLRHTF